MGNDFKERLGLGCWCFCLIAGVVLLVFGVSNLPKDDDVQGECKLILPPRCEKLENQGKHKDILHIHLVFDVAFEPGGGHCIFIADEDTVTGLRTEATRLRECEDKGLAYNANTMFPCFKNGGDCEKGEVDKLFALAVTLLVVGSLCLFGVVVFFVYLMFGEECGCWRDPSKEGGSQGRNRCDQQEGPSEPSQVGAAAEEETEQI